jgi:hypothetical protein
MSPTGPILTKRNLTPSLLILDRTTVQPNTQTQTHHGSQSSDPHTPPNNYRSDHFTTHYLNPDPPRTPERRTTHASKYLRFHTVIVPPTGPILTTTRSLPPSLLTLGLHLTYKQSLLNKYVYTLLVIMATTCKLF